MGLKDFMTKLTAQPRNARYAKLLGGYTPVFSQFGQSVYASDVVQTAIDVIATECSKLEPRHIRTDKSDMITTVQGGINRLLRVAPNELMTTRDFLEKTIWLLYMNYNVFIYPVYEIRTDARGNKFKQYMAFYPLNPNLVEFIQDDSGGIFVRLSFAGGDRFTLPYRDLIHLRKKYSVSEVMGGGMNGQPDNDAILSVLDINDTVLQGIGKAIKASLAIKGVIKINTMLDDEKQAAERARFEASLDAAKSGILPLDLKGEFTPIQIDPKLIDKDTMEFLQNKILNYYGVSVPIISGKFTDDEYQAFYEKTLEPLIISLGQAFSKTLFTSRELDVGNEIVFYPQKLLFTNTKNRIAVANILGTRGALTNNDLLELFGYPPYPEGGTRYMSLNFADVAIANEYQMSRAKMQPGGAGSGDPLAGFGGLEDLPPLDGGSGKTLNGAQVQSLITVVQSVKTGVLSKNAAIELITSAFGLSKEKAEKILEDAV
jgi:HK97 family phage portal protein